MCARACARVRERERPVMCRVCQCLSAGVRRLCFDVAVAVALGATHECRARPIVCPPSCAHRLAVAVLPLWRDAIARA